MSQVAFISTVAFIVIVHTLFYRKLLLVKKHKADEKNLHGLASKIKSTLIGMRQLMIESSPLSGGG